MTRRQLDLVAMLLVGMAIVGVRAKLLDRPIAANDEGTAAGIPLMVSLNFSRISPFETRFAGVLNPGIVKAENRVLYAHHPPTLPLMIAATYRTFGVNEWTSRLIPSIASIATAILLWSIVGKRYGNVAGISAMTLYAFVPLTIGYGDMPDYVGAPLVLAGVACCGRFFDYLDTGKRCDLLISVACFLFGAILDWPIFYLPPVLAVAWMLRRPWKLWWKPVAFGVGCGVLLVALFFWADWANPSESLLSQLRQRIAGQHDQTGERIAIGEWCRKVLGTYQLGLHGVGVVALAIGGGIYLRTRRVKLTAAEALLAWGVLHLLIGYQANYQHVFWSVLTTPGLAACAGILIGVVAQRGDELPRKAIVATILLAGCLIPTIGKSKLAAFGEYEWVGEATYTQRELAAVIRSISAPTDGVLTSDRYWLPNLWFYADRQLRPVVRTPEKLREVLAHPHYLLPFGYYQNYGPAPAWFVMPKQDAAALPDLVAALDRVGADASPNGGFRVWRLR